MKRCTSLAASAPRGVEGMDPQPMKVCPFCKEQVLDGALKCRFCQSTLVALPVAEAAPPDDRRVTYILDRDLVRFGKFAGAVLAMFLVVGASLFGIKLDSAL